MGVCVITTKVGEAGFTPISNLIKALAYGGFDVVLVTSRNFKDKYNKFNNKKIIIEDIGYKITSKNLIPKILDFLVNQIKISYKLIKLKNKYNIALFFIGGEKMVLPIFVSKVLGKKTYILLAGSDYIVESSNSKLLYHILKMVANIVRALVDLIIIYSPNLIEEWDLNEFRYKIAFGYEHIVNDKTFRDINDVSDRRYVGYIGRLSHEKGITKFLEMIDLAREVSDISFLIGGDGELREEVIDFIDSRGLRDRVRYVGWIQKRELCDYLNKIRLLIVPSYTEGLPNVVLEAMACGTPVLATSVGSVPDIVCPNKTGYIVDDNNPKMLFRAMMDALDDISTLQKIRLICRRFVLKRFDEKYVSKRWSKILG